ncbi:MAG TPA: prepilin peptidase [Aliidongia sp.]|nr:prepilin peptidase [Aliidongia sp.]
MYSIDLAAIAGFTGLLLAAGWSDLRRLLIPNSLSLAILVLWPVHAVSASASIDPLGALSMALLVFALGFALFACGLMGGGDVKLLAVTSLWAGPALLPELLIFTTLCGGLIAIVLLSPPGAWFEARVQEAGGLAHLRVDVAPGARRRHRPMPYGVAIALGGLTVAFHLAGF